MNQAFMIKDLEQAKMILEIIITRDRRSRKLWLSLEAYVEKVLDQFNMSGAKLVMNLLVGYFKLIKE